MEYILEEGEVGEDMGGKMFKSLRLRKGEYEVLSCEVMHVLHTVDSYTVQVIPSYRLKEDFGDLDILAVNKGGWINVECIKKWFETDQIINNGGIYSFLFKGFQVDLITVEEPDFKTSLIYLSYNVLGMLMGRIARSLGVRYGTYGLKYHYTVDDQFLGEHVLSKDPEKIFNFLGFDYGRFLKGFDTPEDIFQYVINSVHFKPYLFNFETLDHKNRLRNRKVKLYNDFLVYLKEKDVDLSLPEVKEDLKVDLYCLASNFPESNFSQFILDCRARKYYDNVFKSKFNGHLVKELTGLEGDELGRFIVYLKGFFVNEDVFRFFIIDSNEPQIIVDFINEKFNQYKRELTNVDK